MDVLDEPGARASAQCVEGGDPGIEAGVALGRKVAPRSAGRGGRIHEPRDLGTDDSGPRLGHPGVAQRLREVPIAAEQLRHRLVRRGRLRPHPRAQHGGTAHGGAELGEQAALPDTRRRNDDEPHGRSRAGGGGERIGQSLELGRPAEHRCMEGAERLLAARVRARAGGLPRPDRLRLALHLHRTDGVRLDRLGHRERRQLTDEHGSGRRGGLKAGRGVHRVAGHAPGVRSLGGVDDFAGIHADAQLELVRLQPEPRADALDGRDERQPGPHRAFRVVVPCARRTEDRHRRVTDELLDHPAVALDRLPHAGEVRVLDRRHVLRVEALAERREPDDVGEEDADDPPVDVGHAGRVRGAAILARHPRGGSRPIHGVDRTVNAMADYPGAG